MKRAKHYIPQDILDAAKAAGLSTPLWYAGRRAGKAPLTKTATEIILEAREKAGIKEVTRVKIPPAQKDPYA